MKLLRLLAENSVIQRPLEWMGFLPENKGKLWVQP